MPVAPLIFVVQSISIHKGKEKCLKRNHIYYAQVQGQMGSGKCPRCDLVIYTSKGINIERINFDQHFWEHELLPKLISFYDNCVAPK